MVVIKESLMEIKEERYVRKICGLEYFNVHKVVYDNFEGNEIVDKELWFTFYTTPEKLVNYLRYIAPRLDHNQKLIVTDWGQTQAVVARDLIVYLNGLKNFISWQEDDLYKWNHATLEERVKMLEDEDKPIDCNQLPY